LTEPLQVGQFAIVDHEPVDRGPNAGVFHGKGPTDDRAELYILAEGTTPAGEAFAGHVVSALGNTINSLDMSLTGSLRKLFGEAERNLRDWNRKSIAQHRVSIGLTCFARRGGQSVLAQAGPSAAFHLHEGEFTSYFTDEEHGRPIGAGPVEPQLTRVPFGPGDRLLMISTAALRDLDDEVLAGILALPAPQVLQDLYRRTEHIRHLTAVLISDPGPGAPAAAEAPEEFVIDATRALPALPAPLPGGDFATRAPADNTFQPSLFIDDQSEDVVFSAKRQLMEVTPRRQMEAPVPVLVTELPAPLLRVSGETPLARIAAERQARAAVLQAAVSNSLAAAGTARPAWRTAYPSSVEVVSPGGGGSNGDARRRHPRQNSFSRGLVHEEAPPRPQRGIETMPLVDDLAADRRARATVVSPLIAETIAGEAAATINGGGSLVRVRGNMGGRWKGSGAFNGRSTAQGSLPPTWLVIVIGLGILLTLVGFVTVPRLLDDQSSQRYATLIDGAQQKVNLAQVQQDAAQKRQALTDAKGMLLEARGVQDETPQAAQLYTDIASALAVMDNVKSPAAVDALISLEQFGDKPVFVTRMAIADDAAYVLDSGSNQVISLSYATNGEKKVVFGEDKDQKRGRPVSIAYLDTADFGGASLIVADASKNLWAYSPAGGLRQLAFAAPATLAITDIAVSGRDLYVLDSQAAVVYRFTQTDTGFGATPRKELDTPDLAAARRLMVDGEIITTDANGTVRRFISGQVALTLSESGIDKRLAAPEKAQAVTRDGDLAILDPTNDRVVVLRRDGAFDRQYKHKDFRNANAFAIRNGTAYIFSDGTLRRVTW
jgi:hypothetical protein